MLNVQLISASCKEISEDSEPCGAGISYQEGGARPQERRSRIQISGGSQSRNLLVTDVQHLLLETRLPCVQLEDLLNKINKGSTPDLSHHDNEVLIRLAGQHVSGERDQGNL